MLREADVPLGPFLEQFARLGLSVAFLVPTRTGYEKSIMDATAPVRELLEEEHFHVFEEQLQGPENKQVLAADFIRPHRMQETTVSLYRPRTKKGDPRIWFSGLKQYCQPYNLLALVIHNDVLYVVNLSDPEIAESFLNKGYVYHLLASFKHKSSVVEELLHRLCEIHNEGFLPTITSGDPGVGDTLEHALGINRNNDPTPDYKGIELKATRKTKGGKKRKDTRSNLFAQVPDGGLTYRQILDKYGKWQVPKNSKDGKPRFQLYETFSTLRVNGYGLMLDIDDIADRLYIVHVDEEGNKTKVSWWDMSHLRQRLLEKHPKTFWIEAESKLIGGVESFLYTTVLYTKNPNASLLTPLIAAGKITLDLTSHRDEDGSYRDHGALFKLKKKDLPLLFADPEEFTL